MKSRLKLEKIASSALLFAVFGLLTASLSPAQAAPDTNKTVAETVEVSTQGFPASTDLAQSEVTSQETTVKDARVEQVLKASPAPADLTLATQVASATPVANESAQSSSISMPTVAANQSEEGLDTSADSASSTDSSLMIMPAHETPLTSLQAQNMTSEEVSDQASPAALPVDPLLGEESAEEDPLNQVTNVSQLRDVNPGDWAYEALTNLVERYGCIAGYPDGSFRGNRALSRYEFAAGLNACLTQMERLIGVVGQEGATKEDLETLQRLVDEFSAELATLRTRVDTLEGRVTTLEENQFSTTTKLFGQAVVGVQGRSESDAEFFLNKLEDRNTEINVITNAQLSLFTQFSPRSLLLTGLQAGSGFTGGTFNDTALGYEGNTDNDFVLSDLTYRQLLGNKFAFIVGPVGVNPVNVFRGANRVESAGQGPLSRFAQRNPVINMGGGDAGVGFDWQLAPRISLQGVYAASRAGDADRGGIFGGKDGETVIGGQLTFAPTNTIDVAFQYLNAYSPFGRLNTGVGDDLMLLPNALGRGPINTDAFGATVEWRITPGITLGGWGGYTNSDPQELSGSVETINWMAYLNFPDLFGEGNLGGLYVGQPPKITNSSLPDGSNYPAFVSKGDIFGQEGGQPGTTTHWEAFYRFRVSDNITVTPGLIVIFDPGRNYDNDTITIGSVRTTFTF